VARYEILYQETFMADFTAIDAFDRPKIRAAILVLGDQAEVEVRNRRPLKAPVSWCPEAVWQLRVESYRVLYRVESGRVYVLRVRLKSSGTTEEMGP
jgi:mRNA-degrading endonuclease RelE of RelBE toxin-antitoxin system